MNSERTRSAILNRLTVSFAITLCIGGYLDSERVALLPEIMGLNGAALQFGLNGRSKWNWNDCNTGVSLVIALLFVSPLSLF